MRYPTYACSGAEWLGRIPSHWKAIRIGALFTELCEDGVEGLPILSVSIHDGVSDTELDEKETERKVTRSDDRSKYKLVKAGDLVYNMMRAWQGGFGAVGVDGMVSPAYVVARPKGALQSGLAEQVLRTSNAVEEMRRLSKGITDFRLRLYWDEFKEIVLPVPPREEQAKIMSFLHCETAKIDALVAEQERLMALLKEKRQAVISHAVTKGLNPDAPMKASGVEWLGEVPTHWNVSALKHHWLVTDCKHITATFVTDGPAVASIREVQSRYLFLDNAKRTTPECFEVMIEGGRELIAGDLVYSRNATVGEVAQVPLDHPPVAMGQDVVRLRRTSIQHSPEFLYHLFDSSIHERLLERAMIGSTFRRINVEDIRQFVLPFPPADEQAEIATHLERKVAQFDALCCDAEGAIMLLRERRGALISAAVTGQIDVRHLATADTA